MTNEELSKLEGIINNMGGIDKLEKILNNIQNYNRMSSINIPSILLNYGINSGLSGYLFIIDSVEYLSKHKNSLLYEVYYNVGLKYKKSIGQVERCIRHAVETAFNIQTESFKNDFPLCVKRGVKPTNSAFLKYLSNKIDYLI